MAEDVLVGAEVSTEDVEEALELTAEELHEQRLVRLETALSDQGRQLQQKDAQLRGLQGVIDRQVAEATQRWASFDEAQGHTKAQNAAFEKFIATTYGEEVAQQVRADREHEAVAAENVRLKARPAITEGPTTEQVRLDAMWERVYHGFEKEAARLKLDFPTAFAPLRVMLERGELGRRPTASDPDGYDHIEDEVFREFRALRTKQDAQAKERTPIDHTRGGGNNGGMLRVTRQQLAAMPPEEYAEKRDRIEVVAS